MPVLAQRQRRFFVTLLLAAAVALICGPRARAAPSLEYEVKANYLYKFAAFVEWPPRAFPDPSTPLSICVYGEDPFGSALDDAIRGQTFDGRPILIRRLAAAEPGQDCHILFVSQTKGQSAADALKADIDKPVLIITDGGGNGAFGIIKFVLADGHVRFDVDEAAARASGLAISSKLLSLSISHRRTGS